MSSHIKCGMKCGMSPLSPQRKHPHNSLSPLAIRSIREAGRYADGHGLYLIVDPGGSKRWVLRTVVQGRRRDIGLGGLSTVSLAEARQKASQMRRMAREGGDPLAERRQSRLKVPTFAEGARTVHESRKESWKNEKHAAQWLSSLERYAFPAFGPRAIDKIEPHDILRALAPSWLQKPETAKRVMQRIGTVFDWAKASGFRSTENPVRGITKALPKQPENKEHFSALAYGEVPAFVRRVRTANAGDVAKLAFEFLILTASRTGEVLGAKWEEIDLTTAIWTIPKERMKAKREHRVPLSGRLLQILKAARQLDAASIHVFPGNRVGKPMSNMVFLMILRRMDLDCTAHGFRSAFRDWASERTNFSREVCEMALAHTIKNKAEAAYRRGDLLDKRRELMETWARFVTAEQAQVVAIRAS